MKSIERINAALADGNISESARDNIERWLKVDLYASMREDLRQMIAEGQWEELNEGFYQVLPFGTGGRRGEVGIGCNRLNEATYSEAAQGVANALSKEITDRPAKVVVAYDTRLTSATFTEVVACVLAANDIEVNLFDGPRSTPQLSFAIRDLTCDAGIVISASHNPPKDNGFKAYWSDGGQVVPPKDAALIEEVKKVEEVKRINFAEAYGKGLIKRLKSDADQRYKEAVIGQSVCSAREVRIAYSSIHGAGIQSIYPMLQQAGFADLHLVENQKDPDGRFPNVANHQPNPEITTGLDAVVELAQAIGADLAMASDPDADRLACAVRNKAGAYIILTGNQCAALMIEHICSHMKAAGTLRPDHRVYSTCVSSPLMPSIAREYGLSVKNDLLVGFKWIGEQIEAQEDPEDFLFASEESIGFMKGPKTRDKDGGVAALLMAELTAVQKAEGRSVLEQLDKIYLRYGYFCDLGTHIFLEGIEGKDRMERILGALRKDPPSEIGGQKVVKIVDRLTGKLLAPGGIETGEVEGAKSNLLIFHLREDAKSWIAIRPSGTEPKIKFYFSLYAPVEGDLQALKVSQKAAIEAVKDATVELAMGIK